jgi:Ca2+-binding RTX toxin-like protein
MQPPGNLPGMDGANPCAGSIKETRMATHTIKSDFTKTYEIKTSNDEWTFTKDFSVDVDGVQGYGIFVSSQYVGNTVTIDGRAHGDMAGVVSLADDTTITLGATAKVTGGVGIGLAGDGISLVNDGKIVAGTFGVYSEAADHVIFTNRRSVRSDVAVFLTNNSRVINAEGATLTGSKSGVVLNGAGEAQSRLVNHGTITGTEFAVVGDQGGLTVVNDGMINGIIDLGSGRGRFDNRGGVVVNDDNGVRGGLDNDTLITDSAKVKLIEVADQGIHDTVRSTVSYRLSSEVEDLVLLGSKDTNATGTNVENVIHGNSGDNLIRGRLGVDDLFGHKGSDILTGGGNADFFHFLTGDGRDVITDFENGLDKADISGWTAISDFDDLMEHHVEFKNGDAIITAGKDSLTLTGVAEADLDAGDFVFGT